MAIKIREFRGYTVAYDEVGKGFRLLNADGVIVAEGKTQDEVEAQAEKLRKQAFMFPIEAFLTSGLDLYPGRVTSLNVSDRSARFAYQEKDSYRAHTKVHLSYSHVYEATDHNKEIVRQVVEKRAQYDTLTKEILGLLGQLEKPIDETYFKLKGLV